MTWVVLINMPSTPHQITVSDAFTAANRDLRLYRKRLHIVASNGLCLDTAFGHSMWCTQPRRMRIRKSMQSTHGILFVG